MTGKILSFIGGSIAGSLITWIVTKKHYEKKAQQEIYEARQTFKKMLKQASENTAENSEVVESTESYEIADEPTRNETVRIPAFEKDDDGETKLVYKDYNKVEHDDSLMTNYRDILSRRHYDLQDDEIDQMIWNSRRDTPIVIDDSEYGDEFECISLTWLAEGYLVDETTGNQIKEDEIGELIGMEAVSKLKTTHNDVYVRNNALCVEIEVVYDDSRTYADFVQEIQEEAERMNGG